ncbi:hypothetical protein RJT34_15994 [Clitoria ternatea]|uniref:F-box domain-containing protein n=1 Tax=Clitoria ternatea TaxID=43366 RepID=A0AAN9PBY3_CLITE
MSRQKQVYESGAEWLPVLPDHLIVEILSWAPVKSLIRFKCVSKSWNSLIGSDSHFRKLHLQRSSAKPTNLQLLIDSSCVETMGPSWPVTELLDNPSYTLNPKPQHLYTQDHSFIGTCNGLIALRGSSIYRVGLLRYFWVCFWNPATRTKSRNSPSCYGLTRFGFGYDPINDTYKVVGLFSNPIRLQVPQRDRVRVYSMGGNCWRDVASFPEDGVTLEKMNGVCVNGTLNWVAFRHNSDNIVKQVVIVSFHLGNETNAEFPLPNLLDHETWFLLSPTLWVLKDCLYVSHYHAANHYMIWQMKEFGVKESWRVFLNIDLDCLPSKYPGFRMMPLPMCLFENNNVLMIFSEGFYQRYAVLYKHKDSTVASLGIRTTIFLYSVLYYAESLVSVSPT